MQLSAVLMELELREWCHDVIGADRPLNKKEPAKTGSFLNGRDDRLSLSETKLSLGKRMQLSAVLMELELREWCHDVIGADRPNNKKRTC